MLTVVFWILIVILAVLLLGLAVIVYYVYKMIVKPDDVEGE